MAGQGEVLAGLNVGHGGLVEGVVGVAIVSW